MMNKISLRLRITVITCMLLSICCIVLAVFINTSGREQMNRAAVIVGTSKTTELVLNKEIVDATLSSATKELLKPTFQMFNLSTVLYSMVIVLIGGIIIYFLSARMLKPVRIFSENVLNITEKNLAEKVELPEAKDEIYQLTKSFNYMTSQLSEFFEAQKKFSAHAAHELRTPLAVLQTKFDVFYKEKNHTEEEYTQLLNDLQKQVTRLSSLSTNLLEFSELDKVNLDNPVEIYSMLDEIVCDLLSIAEKKGITLSLSGDESIINGDDPLLYRAFYNLIDNAIKYNVTSGTVRVKVVKRDGQSIVTIFDTGIGIPDEMKQNVINPFVRVDKSRSREFGGVGLGLAIAVGIIKKHNGTLSITDNKPKGTIIKVTFNN